MTHGNPARRTDANQQQQTGRGGCREIAGEVAFSARRNNQLADMTGDTCFAIGGIR